MNGLMANEGLMMHYIFINIEKIKHPEKFLVALDIFLPKKNF